MLGFITHFLSFAVGGFLGIMVTAVVVYGTAGDMYIDIQEVDDGRKD